MNLYLITTKKERDYDTFDSAVVVAATAEDAKLIHPDPKGFYCKDAKQWKPREGRIVSWLQQEWVQPGEVEVELIGTTDPYREGDVILASFNAG